MLVTISDVSVMAGAHEPPKASPPSAAHALLVMAKHILVYIFFNPEPFQPQKTNQN